MCAVLVFCPIYYPNRFWWIEKVAHHINMWLTHRWYKIVVVTYYTWSNVDLKKHNEITIILLPITAINESYIKKYKAVDIESIIKQHINISEIQSIICHDRFFAETAQKLNRKHNISLISFFHSRKEDEYNIRWETTNDSYAIKMQKQLAENSSVILVASDFMLDSLSNRYVNHTVDKIFLWLSHSNKNINIQTNKQTVPTFYYYGRLAKEKKSKMWLRYL